MGGCAVSQVGAEKPSRPVGCSDRSVGLSCASGRRLVELAGISSGWLVDDDWLALLFGCLLG